MRGDLKLLHSCVDGPFCLTILIFWLVQGFVIDYRIGNFGSQLAWSPGE